MKYCTVTFPVNTYTLSDLELICNAVRFCFMNYCSFKMTNSYTCYPLLNIFINLVYGWISTFSYGDIDFANMC